VDLNIPIPITDHVAVGDRICRELLMVCPDPNLPDYEGRDDERRLNVAIRSVLSEAMDLIEHSQRMRQIQVEKDDLGRNAELTALKLGMNVGEETAAKRMISRFALAFNGY
jgi:hypothetical protein